MARISIFFLCFALSFSCKRFSSRQSQKDDTQVTQSTISGFALADPLAIILSDASSDSEIQEAAAKKDAVKARLKELGLENSALANALDKADAAAVRKAAEETLQNYSLDSVMRIERRFDPFGL